MYWQFQRLNVLTTAQPKYWCKHCSTYVRDTAFEKRQHEATGKHQGNLKRFLRDIQNNHERGERDKERAKAEVERLNKVVGGGAAGTGTSTDTSNVPSKPASTFRKPSSTRLTSEDQKRQWSQLAEMGIDVPDNYRAEMAMAGDWKSVAHKKNQNNDEAADSLSVGVRKRRLDEQEQEDLDAGSVPTAKKVWGKSVRTYPGHETQDLDSLLSGSIALKTDKQEDEVKQERIDARASPTPDGTDPVPNADASASPTAWRTAVLAKQQTSDDSTTRVKSESAAGMTGDDASPPSHMPQEAPIPVFKKRRAKAPPAQ